MKFSLSSDINDIDTILFNCVPEKVCRKFNDKQKALVSNLTHYYVDHQIGKSSQISLFVKMLEYSDFENLFQWKNIDENLVQIRNVTFFTDIACLVFEAQNLLDGQKWLDARKTAKHRLDKAFKGSNKQLGWTVKTFTRAKERPNKRHRQ